VCTLAHVIYVNIKVCVCGIKKKIKIFTTRILRFIDGIFCLYLYYYFACNEYTDWLTDRNAPSVIFGMSVSLSVIEKYLLPMDLLMGKCAKKNLPVSFCLYFPQKTCHIMNKNIVCNFMGD
jgi:hypothetical protein